MCLLSVLITRFLSFDIQSLNKRVLNLIFYLHIFLLVNLKFLIGSI